MYVDVTSSVKKVVKKVVKKNMLFASQKTLFYYYL
jgi:hypothetical protein